MNRFCACSTACLAVLMFVPPVKTIDYFLAAALTAQSVFWIMDRRS